MTTSEVPEPGTPVKVVDTRNCSWVFRYVNADGSWCVYGGRNGQNQMQSLRSFVPDRCIVIVSKPKRERSK